MIHSKKRLFSVLVFILIISVFGIVTVLSLSAENNREENQTWIYIAGDSTAASYPEDRAPRTGWGQVLDSLFDDKIKVINKAASGRSSKSFIEEGRLEEILAEIQPGDYLFIQFGHNDAKEDRPTLYTEPFTTYKNYLLQYIEGARDKGAIPVLLTSVEKRAFTGNGLISPSHGNYPEAMKELAHTENVPLLNMTERTTELYNQLGPNETRNLFMWLKENEHPNYPEGATDDVHFREAGAIKVATLVAEEIHRSELVALRNHLTIDFENKNVLP